MLNEKAKLPPLGNDQLCQAGGGGAVSIFSAGPGTQHGDHSYSDVVIIVMAYHRKLEKSSIQDFS